MNTHNSVMPKQQRGAALIILAVIIILTVSLIVVSKMGRNGDTLQANDNVDKLLAEAREHIIGIAVSNSILPGMLLYPDRVTGGGLDGIGDCTTSFNNRTLFIGQLPYRGQQLGGCNNIEASLDTSQSTYPLHYAVSANLLQYTNGTTVNTINANVVNLDDGNLFNNAENWLTVFDNNGAVLSDRVAFIIFFPGSALTTATGYVQNRSGNTPDTTEFLDSVNVPGLGTIDNANATDSRFIKGAKSNTFNDKLVYVTAEELMRRVEMRMLHEAENSITHPLPMTDTLSPSDFSNTIVTNWVSAGAGATNLINTYDSALNNTAGYSRTSITYAPRNGSCPPGGGGNNGNGNGNNGNGNGNGGGNGNGNNGNGNGNGNNGNGNPNCTPATQYECPLNSGNMFTAVLWGIPDLGNQCVGLN